MTCPCELRAQREEAARLADRAAYERNLDWQFAVISKARKERGERALTRSEWLAGCYGDDENGDISPRSRTAPLIVSALYAVSIVAVVGIRMSLACIVFTAFLFGPLAVALLLERRIAKRGTDQRKWFPHLDYSGAPMLPGHFRDPPETMEDA